MPGYFCRLDQRVAELLPCAKTTLQRTHSLNPKFLQFLRHPGAGSFVRSSTVENDLPILRQLSGASGYILRQHAKGAGQSSRI